MTVLVTGGGGFLGGAIVRMLVARGESARSFTRSAYPWLDELGVVQYHGDLTDADAVAKAAQGCDAVIHVAAKAGVWGRYSDFAATNVQGTKNVVAACRVHGISKLVFTSTPSVVHAGQDIENGDESLPYAERFEAAYPATKADAERIVRAANDATLATVALRPHLIWGPGDPHLIPRLLARAKTGKLRRIGDRDVIVDVTYIDNAAHAHVLALDKLSVNSPVAGRVYFITNGEPLKMWDFLNRVLAEAGLPPVTKTVPVWLARRVGSISEALHRIFRLTGEPAMTRFLASQLSTSHWFNIAAARHDLGYKPLISLDEGLKRFAATMQG